MKKATEDRCRTAGCCKAFPLPPWIDVANVKAHPERYADGETIAAMLYPSGVKDACGRDLWNCFNLNPITNDCMIYERRPQMCREYPYGMRCNVVGCTMKPNPPEMAR